MSFKKVLWLDDQYNDFGDYSSALFNEGYIVEHVRSVTEAEQKLREGGYIAAIFDIKVLPGDDPKWLELDKKKRTENPNFDSNLGFELLLSLFESPDAKVELVPRIHFDPRKVIVFSVVYDKVWELSALGILGDRIVNKSNSDLKTLPSAIKRIEKLSGGKG